MEAEKQPRICFQVVSNWYIGPKPAYSAIFPANLLNFKLGLLWAGVMVLQPN
jgi:hypothetical protein